MNYCTLWNPLLERTVVFLFDGQRAFFFFDNKETAIEFRGFFKPKLDAMSKLFQQSGDIQVGQPDIWMVQSDIREFDHLVRFLYSTGVQQAILVEGRDAENLRVVRFGMLDFLKHTQGSPLPDGQHKRFKWE